MNLAKYRKFAVALAGVIAQLVALGVLHGAALHYAQVVLSALAALGVYATPNADSSDEPEDWAADDNPPPATPPHAPEHAA